MAGGTRISRWCRSLPAQGNRDFGRRAGGGQPLRKWSKIGRHVHFASRRSSLTAQSSFRRCGTDPDVSTSRFRKVQESPVAARLARTTSENGQCRAPFWAILPRWNCRRMTFATGPSPRAMRASTVVCSLASHRREYIAARSVQPVPQNARTSRSGRVLRRRRPRVSALACVAGPRRRPMPPRGGELRIRSRAPWRSSRKADWMVTIPV